MPLISCPDCNKEISDAAPICPSCGRPMVSAPFRADAPIGGSYVAKRKRSSGLGAFVLLLLGMAITGWYYLGGNSVRTTSDMVLESYFSRQPIASVTARDIISAYEQNEVSADRSYRGSIVDVSGYIASIKKDLSDDLYITLDGAGASRYRSVQAYFSPDLANRLASLRKGQAIVVRCRIEGLFINVRGRDCTLP